jgi:CHAT domain
VVEPADQRSEDHRAAAWLLLQQGLIEGVIAESEAAVEISRSEGDAAGEGAAELLLVRAYRDDGAVGEEHDRLALLHAERAEAAFRRAGDQSGLTDALIFQTLHFEEAGDSTRVAYTLDKLERFDAGTASWLRIYTDALANMFHDPHRAIDLFHQALESLHLLARGADGWRQQCLRKLSFLTEPTEDLRPTSSSEKPTTWRNLFVEAIRLASSGREDREIEPLLDESIRAAEDLRLKIRSEVKQRELSGTMDPLYTAKVALANRAERYSEALDTIEMNTSRSLLSRQAMRFLWGRSPVHTWKQLQQTNELITECLIRYQRSSSTGHWEQLRLALKRRREASHSVQEELVRIVPPPHPSFIPSDSLHVQEVLGNDAVVVFLPDGDVYVLRSSGVERATTVDLARIGVACDRYRALVSEPGRPGAVEELVAVDTEIGTGCIEPLLPLVREGSRVLIVPNGPLWKVPLATLGRRPLADSHAVSIVPNLSVADRLLRRPRPARRVERFVGIGNPDETLPSAAEEVERVAKHFDDHAVLTGENVDFAEALILCMDADVIHMACHGVSFEEYPELSFLHIAGPPEAPMPLFVEDVIRIAMAPRLVVLSACHAGTSTAFEGNEYVGFPGAFLVADATTVVAPLWAIPDTSAMVLMETFYRESRRLPPSQALRAAQDFLRADPATAHPLHWAGFEVFGLS